MCGVIVKSQENTNPEKSTAGFMGPGKLVSRIYIQVWVTKEQCRRERRGVVTNCPGQEQPGRSAGFLRLTSCRETRRICRERFWERRRYLVAETTVSYGRGVASTSLLAPEKVVCSEEKLLGSWSLAENPLWFILRFIRRKTF